MEKIILASASPRRKELLEQLGLKFTVWPAKGEEIITESDPQKIVRELAQQKAQEIADQVIRQQRTEGADHAKETIKIIGADTIVVHENEIFGKPKDTRDAYRMIERLQGDTHQVYTGVCVITLFADPQKPEEVQIKTFDECTDVIMYPLDETQIRAYIATGEPMDKAGAYGIQGIGARLIREIHGDYYNVVGLPIARLWQELD